MTNKSGIIVGAIALVVAVIALFSSFGASKLNLGAEGDSNFTNLVASGDITAGDDLTVTDDMTVSGGVFTVTTANSATSTAIIGCIQSYATSTATPWKWLTVASSTQIAPGYNGYILAQYGTCPSI